MAFNQWRTSKIPSLLMSVQQAHVRLHFSTLRKVDILANLADRADQEVIFL